MDRHEIDRRQFSQLAATALAGMLAGASSAQAFPDAPAAEKNPLLSDPHVCRGLNTCKNKGASKMNACAGQGTCATAKAHSCHAENECRGQGGCGSAPGENSCKGKGACSVPMHAGAWKKARKRFEELMTKEGKQFSPAPEKKS